MSTRPGGGARRRTGARPASPARRREAAGAFSDMPARLLVAIPAVFVAVVLISAGGLPYALGLIALGLIALHELYRLTERVRPIKLAGFLAVIGLVLAAAYGGPFQILLVLMATFPVVFFLALVRPGRDDVAWAVAVTFLGVLWVGLPLAHAVLLRDLPHGAGLLVDVLVGTFLGDTAAYFGGRIWGRRLLAPGISPNKTVEGLLAGVVGGTLAFWVFAIAYQDWFRPGWHALLIGFCVALAAPMGDLFESLVKRDLEVKDTGRFFGVHGGVLDRLDAAFFTVPTGYYVAVALL